jgi:hypothetical protein
MTTLRRIVLLTAAALLPAFAALAQTAKAEPAPAAEPAERAWSFSVSAYAYLVPGDDDYIQPTFTADWKWLHLEARYNYEALHAGSLWAGYNWSVGEKVTFEGNAMLGGVFGDTTGVAPGYKATLGWTKLAFYSEGEYLFDSNASSDSFFYAWSELTWAPADWCRFGLAGQRTRVYQTDREIQRGFLLGFSSKHVDFTAYVFNPDERTPTVVLALGVNF